MKKLLLALVFSIAAVFVGSSAAQASVENFLISDFQAEYALSQLEDGRSKLIVTETIVADFPDFNQNKGIVRAIPERYNTFSLEFQLLTVTRNGLPEPIYEQTIESGNHIVALGTNDFLQGRQTYQIQYQLENVITEYDGYQEFFWNVNGTQWGQQILNVEAQINIDPALEAQFTDSICFQGEQGSTESCTATIAESGTKATAQATRVLGVGENLSVALKLPADSFALPAKTLSHTVPYILLGVAILLLAGILFVLVRYGRDHPGRGLTPTQYLPPKDIPLLTAAKVKGKFSKVMPAQLVDLSVRGAVALIDQSQIGKKGEFTVRFLRDTQLDPEERLFLTLLFSSIPSTASEFRFTKTQDVAQKKVARSLSSFLLKTSRASSDGVYRHQPKLLKLSWIPLFAVFIGAFIWVEFYDYAPVVSAITAGISVAYFVLALVATGRHPLTQEGRELKDYLVGLERYITVAEQDRLAFLQSVEGAERRESVVRLYERVLPYAILFGHEKSWVKVLQLHYVEESNDPLWIQGAGVANLSRTISTLSTTSSSYGFTASSGGGGSGFSGGSSGGGGGGGGGGR